MKKVFSILVVVAMLCAFLVPSAFATEEPQIVISSVEAVGGDEIKLTVSLKNNPGITNGKITVTYDETGLEFVKIDTMTMDAFMNGIQAMSNGTSMNFVATADVTADVELFYIYVKVKDTAAGDYKLGLNIELMKNNAEEDVVFTVVEGVVSTPAAEPAPEAQIVISSAEAVAGDEVKLTVSLKNNPGITNGKITVTYDETGLEFVKIDTMTMDAFMNGIQAMSNGTSMNFVATADVTADVELFYIYVKVKDTAAGDYKLGLNIELMKNNAEENVVFTVVEGVVSVGTAGCAHPALVHIEAVEPACHFNGNIEYWYCNDCELVWADEALTQITNHKSVILPAIGGEVVHVEAKAPSCYEEGNIEHWYCEECEQVWQDEALTQLTNHKNVILPAAHDTIAHVEAVEPGCHFDGNIEYWYCAECDTVWADEAMTQITNHKNVILPATGGDVAHVDAVAPSCHFDGNIEYWYCTECEQVWQDEALTQLTNHKNVILPATGGDVAHVDAVAPGCHFNGNIEYWYCTECEQVWQDEALTQLTNHKNVILPAIGGDVIHVEAKAPTCTEEGNIEHWYCDECEQVWQDEARTQLTNHKNVIVAATGHNFVEGVCTICGEKDPNYVPETGDSIFVAIAVALISGLGIVALTTKKREF